MEPMNLQDEINTYTELNLSGALPKEDYHDSMESRKPTSIIIWKNLNFDIIAVYNEKISTKKYSNYFEKLTDNWGRPICILSLWYLS